jgi:hypothetical protein
MVTDGAIAFEGGTSARIFIEDFDRQVESMQARFGALRVDSLGPGLATFAAPYEEQIELLDGRQTTFKGYVTAVAREAGASWRVLQLHWSRSSTMADR